MLDALHQQALITYIVFRLCKITMELIIDQSHFSNHKSADLFLAIGDQKSDN